MKQTGEILINLVKLNIAQNDMSRLARDLRGHRLTLTLRHSEGETAEELLALGQSLQQFGDAFASVAENCTAFLCMALKEAEEADDRAAKMFSNK